MKFIVEGEPIPLQRARRAKNFFYDPQFQAKQNFAWIIKKQLPSTFQLITNQIEIKIEFHMPIPKSISNKKYQSLINQPHIKKKDLDNLCKFIMDALNGILWEDDCLIWKIEAQKIYSDKPKTIFEII